MTYRGVAIIPSGQQYFIDHLAPLAHLMQIPLLCLEPEEAELARKYYPDVDVQEIDHSEFSLDYLFANYDVLFLSEFWSKQKKTSYYQDFTSKYGKDLISVHCPHGFSDKGFHFKLCVDEDLNLIYGPNMLDLLAHENVKEKLGPYVLIGNYREAYFEKYRSFYEGTMHAEILSQFEKRQQTILYAPTWNDAEGTSTLTQAYESILSKVPEQVNLIVKLHPMVELREPGLYHHLHGRYRGKNVFFLERFPPINPLLSITDIYLGDMSSIGYDFLAYGKPMFFLPSGSGENRALLYTAGRPIARDEYAHLYEIIERELPRDAELYGRKREALLDYTFGKALTLEEIRMRIDEALRKLLATNG